MSLRLNDPFGAGSFFSANRDLFRSRFRELAALIGLDSDELTRNLVARIPSDYELVPTAAETPTISVHGVLIQSRHDPVRDAKRAFESPGFSSGIKAAGGYVFAGCALALLPEFFAKENPDATIVLIEPDIFLFLLCLAARPLDALFAHERLVFMVGAPPREVCALLEKLELSELPIYENPAITGANRPWFAEFANLRKRNREKREINANTLKRFGPLWLSNMSHNLAELRDRDGIGRFEGAFADTPILVLAAGPSLDRVLPHLPELRKHCVIIAVDTALRACVRSGVEPDFIILVDPQYWNWRHLDGVVSRSSILITESAAWPAVFRFPCRNIFLCASLFPLGRFIEERTEKRGELGAGGSVATTAWDFARHLGARTIYMAGLDLGFPDRKTHFTGSIFEDRTHTVSHRLSPAETAGFHALYGAGPHPVPDYRGGTVLTDRRLILYAWWFESRLAQFPEIHTATLTPEGVKIPGFSVATTADIENLPNRRTEMDIRLELLGKAAPHMAGQDRNARFMRAIDELLDALEDLDKLTERGLTLCDRYDKPDATGKEKNALLGELNGLDRKILSHRAKEITAMVFSADDAKTGGAEANPIGTSRAMYRCINLAVRKNLDSLSNFIKDLRHHSDI